MVLRQIQGEYKSKDKKLDKYYEMIIAQKMELKELKIGHIDRDLNEVADGLARKGVQNTREKQIVST